MPLSAGDRLGPYEVTGELGAGGMGIVLRARDTKLDRAVALKVLPEAFTADPDRLARFEREAKVLASLNHPNIGHIYGLEEAKPSPTHEVGRGVSPAAVKALVLELVEGPTLADRIARGPIPLDEALPIAAQIAEALEAAHEQGIIHRDLKPANVKVKDDGTVKVLDFGLAKALRGDATGDPSESPTLTAAATQQGVIMGTAAYMSPEQARGKPVDRRADIWAFGTVVFEMLTGQQPFASGTRSDSLAAVLRDDPDWDTLPADTPDPVRRVLRRCVEKDRRDRLQHIGDARVELREIMASRRTGPHRGSRGSQPSGLDKTRRAPMLVGVALATLIAGYAVLRYAGTGGEAPIVSVAVLPFENVGGDSESEYLADGITRSLINTLSAVDRLRVRPWGTVLRYKGQAGDLEEAGRDLDVGAVVLGRVQLRGEALEVGAELVNVTEGIQLWGDQYDRPAADLMAIQEELSMAIAENLRLRLSGEEEVTMVRRATGSPRAYQLYLQGRYQCDSQREEGFDRGISYLEEAIQEDATFASAFAGLADCYTLLAEFAIRPPGEVVPRAKEYALEALALDDRLADAHVSLGIVRRDYDWDWAGAERSFRRAIALNPESVRAHREYASLLQYMDRPDDAMVAINRAVDLDPLSVRTNMNMAALLSSQRQYDEAEEQYMKTLELEPSNYNVHYNLGRHYVVRGMYAEAAAEFLRSLELIDEQANAADEHATLGYVYGRWGKTDEALQELEEVLAIQADDYVGPVSMALIYVGLGDADEAFRWLERAVEERSGWLLWNLNDPIMDPVRSDPRFQEILRRVNFRR